MSRNNFLLLDTLGSYFFLPPRAEGSAVAEAPIDARSANEPPKI